jgi:hypothetical protein
MPKSKPDAAILLAAAVKYLEDELIPTLSGYHRFQTRVTVNVLAIAARELELGERHAADEQARLVSLTGHDGTLAALNDEVCTMIRSAPLSPDDAALRAHVRQSLAEALAINNPKWVRPASP